MQANILTLNSAIKKPFELAETSAKMTISDVFAERKGTYINEFTLFIAHFNSIPNFIHEVDIDCEKANIWFSENYKSEIKDLYYDKRYFNRSNKAEIDDVFYFLYEDLIVNIDTQSSEVRFLYRKTELPKVEEIVNSIYKFKKRKQRQAPKISLLVNYSRGIGTKSLKITKPKLRIEDNYNEDFKEIHQTILKRLPVKMIKV